MAGLKVIAATVAAAIAIGAGGITGGASAGTPRCGAGALALSVKHDGGAAGTQLYTIRLRNKSRHPCKLGGYPGVSLLGANHRQLGASAKRVAGRLHKFTLRPGQTAAARFTAPSVECGNGRRPRESSFVRVIPPNTRSSLIAKLHATACRLTIQPLHKAH